MPGKSAIEKDFNRSPIIRFKTKANALKAKELATKKGVNNMTKQTIGHYKTKKEAEKKARELRAYKIGKRPIRVVKRDIGYDVMVPM